MIQDVKFINDWRAGLFKIPNGADNFGVFHIARRIVVEPNGNDPRMEGLALPELTDEYPGNLRSFS